MRRHLTLVAFLGPLVGCGGGVEQGAAEGDSQTLACEQAIGILQNCTEGADPAICSDDAPAAKQWRDGGCSSSVGGKADSLGNKWIGEACLWNWQCKGDEGLTCGRGHCGFGILGWDSTVTEIGGLRVGALHKIPSWTSTRVVATEAIENETGHLVAGARCELVGGEGVKILGFRTSDGKVADAVLLGYSRSVTHEFATVCPSGTLFFLSPEELDALLNGGGLMQAEGKHTLVRRAGWVHVANSEPISNSETTFELGDECNIPEWVYVRLVSMSAADNDAVLLYASGNKEARGLECPTSTKFHRPLSDLSRW